MRQAAAAVLLFALSVTAIGQQTPQLASNSASTPTAPTTPAAATAPAVAPTRAMIKVMKSLSRYDEGEKLDIQLTGGSHQVGTVGETRSTCFVFVDSVSGKSRTIDYLDVEGIRATGKGSTARQFHKAMSGHSGVVIGTVVVVVVLGVIALFSFHK
jgi:ribosomal protein L21E